MEPELVGACDPDYKIWLNADMCYICDEGDTYMARLPNNLHEDKWGDMHTLVMEQFCTMSGND